MSFTASLSGDFSKLTAFSNRVAAFGSPALMRQISKEIADEALFQVQKGFSEQRDPYGPQWFPKKFDDGRKILRGSSGKLERSFVRLYAGPDAAIIGSKVRYAGFQQTGTGIYGPSGRRITPKNGKALRFKVGGRWMFAKSVEGSRQRMMMPSPHRNSVYWGKAFQARVSSVLRARLAGRGGGVL
jgi:phage gpG-like protein